jgi:hypothetical protein
MKKFALPPRASLANNILILLLSISALMSLLMALSNPIFSIGFIIAFALTVGVFIKHPAAYATIMIVSFIGIALALKNTNIIDAIIDALCVGLALYIRSNLYVLKEQPDENFHAQ